MSEINLNNDDLLQVLRRSTQQVWASPSHRRMDSKSESEEMTYPFVCFTVDNFDEAFSDIQVGLLSKSNFDAVFQVRDGEMVAVELVARDTRGSMEAVLSLGCIQYDSTRSVVFFDELYFDYWWLEALFL